MPYITVPRTTSSRQLTLDDVFNEVLPTWFGNEQNTHDTVTRYVEYVTPKVAERFDYNDIKYNFECFNREFRDLIETADKSTLYHSFKIPKRSGGLRQIDDPCPRLREAIERLRMILESRLKFTYHTNAMAYIESRSVLTACQRHQASGARWRLKTDLHGFFPSSNEAWVLGMLERTFPLSEYVRQGDSYRREFEKAMSICFLRGGLPQGSPASPMITNQMMIPIDHAIAEMCRNHKPHLCYTRYADDMDFSSACDFNWGDVYSKIKCILAGFDAPFSFNDKKTRYGRMGWMLGIRFSDEGALTVGAEKKAVFRAMLNSFAFSYKNGEPWDLEETQHLQGLYSYYRGIEKEHTDKLVKKAGEKAGINILEAIKEIIRKHAA